MTESLGAGTEPLDLDIDDQTLETIAEYLSAVAEDADLMDWANWKMYPSEPGALVRLLAASMFLGIHQLTDILLQPVLAALGNQSTGSIRKMLEGEGTWVISPEELQDFFARAQQLPEFWTLDEAPCKISEATGLDEDKFLNSRLSAADFAVWGCVRFFSEKLQETVQEDEEAVNSALKTAIETAVLSPLLRRRILFAISGFARASLFEPNFTHFNIRRETFTPQALVDSARELGFGQKDLSLLAGALGVQEATATTTTTATTTATATATQAAFARAVFSDSPAELRAYIRRAGLTKRDIVDLIAATDVLTTALYDGRERSVKWLVKEFALEFSEAFPSKANDPAGMLEFLAAQGHTTAEEWLNETYEIDQ